VKAKAPSWQFAGVGDSLTKVTVASMVCRGYVESESTVPTDVSKHKRRHKQVRTEGSDHAKCKILWSLSKDTEVNPII
jgi:hypothetical protein